MLFFCLKFNYLFDPASEAGVLASFDDGVLAAFESIVLALELAFSVVVVEAGVLEAFDVVSAFFHILLKQLLMLILVILF